MGTRALVRIVVVASLVAGGLVVSTGPAAADHHAMLIREVGLDGNAGSDFVELQMYSSGQNFVQGHKLVTYDQTGAPTELTIPSDVANGENQSTILFASPGFVGTPDFTLPNGLMTTSSGAVCFVSTTGFGTIDCVEWGGGVSTVSADPPATAPMAAQSLERRIAAGCATRLEAGDDTNSSAADFAVQSSPNPEPNSATPNEAPCPPGTPGGSPLLRDLKTKVKGGRAIITGRIEPPAPGQRVKLTFFANGSPLRKLATKNATLNDQSRFRKSFRVPSDSTRCRVRVVFGGQPVGKKTFRC